MEVQEALHCYSLLLSWYGEGCGCRQHAIFHPSLEGASMACDGKEQMNKGVLFCYIIASLLVKIGRGFFGGAVHNNFNETAHK
jgi:hypothetical protein